MTGCSFYEEERLFGVTVMLGIVSEGDPTLDDSIEEPPEAIPTGLVGSTCAEAPCFCPRDQAM
jgi:hypothetical protein